MIVSERLEHSSITPAFGTYSHVLLGMQRESANKLNARLFSDDAAEVKPYN